MPASVEFSIKLVVLLLHIKKIFALLRRVMEEDQCLVIKTAGSG